MFLFCSLDRVVSCVVVCVWGVVGRKPEEGERKKREMERWREMERERETCAHICLYANLHVNKYMYMCIYIQRESVERYSERAGEWESGGVVIETSPLYLSHHCPGAGDGDRNKPPA